MRISEVMVELKTPASNVIEAGFFNTAEMSCNITTMNADTAEFEYVWYKRNANGNQTNNNFIQIHGNTCCNLFL